MKSADIEKLLPYAAVGIGLYILYQTLKPVAQGAGNVVGAATAGVSGELNDTANLVTGAFSPYSSVYNWLTGAAQ